MKKNLYAFQNQCVDFILQNKRVGLFLDMGMGKTVIALTAANILLKENKIKKVLIIAPKSVAQNSWHTEIANWDHLQHLTYSKIFGNEQQREQALRVEANVYIIGRDNVSWLKSSGNDKFGMVVVDESSSFKNRTSKRFQSLVNFKYVYCVLLTGTPIPNGYIDLWSQIFLLDHGVRLGNFKQYLNSHFKFNTFGEATSVKDEKELLGKISDLTKSIDNNTARIEYPCVIYRDHYLELGEGLITEYTQLKTTLKLTEDISAKNAQVVIGKLMQFCNGNIYYDKQSPEYKYIHNQKIEALKELLEATNSNVLVTYQFKSDLDNLQKHLKDAIIFKSDDESIVSEWNSGKIKLLLCHPASSSMGLNLQFGGNVIVWYSLTWNLEHYLQFNARLDRPGQKKNVVINHLICRDTIEEIILKSLSNKEKVQSNLINYLN